MSRAAPLLALLLLAGCTSPAPDAPSLPSTGDLFQRHGQTQYLDLQLSRALARRGWTGDALRRIQLAKRRKTPPGWLGGFEVSLEHYRLALTNQPLELSRELIDLEPPPPPRCCDQPRVIRKLER